MITPVVCSGREVTKLLFSDATGTLASNVPEYSFSNEYNIKVFLGLAQPDQAHKILFIDRFFSVAKEVVAVPSTIRTVKRYYFTYIDKVRNLIYIVCEVQSAHPQNISGNNDEVWVGKMDLTTGNVDLIVRLEASAAVSVLEYNIQFVDETYVYYVQGSTGTVNQYKKIEIATGTISTIYNSGMNGSLYPSVKSGLEAGEVIGYVSYGADGGSRGLRPHNLKIRKINYTTSNVDEFELNTGDHTSIAHSKNQFYTVVKGDIIFIFVFNADAEIQVFNLKTHEFIERIETVSSITYQGFLSENLETYVQVPGGKMQIYGVVPIKSTDLLRSNGNILGLST